MLILFLKDCYARQRVAPFETMIGFLVIFVGIITVLDFGIIHTPINEIFVNFVGYKLYLLLNMFYILSGLCIFIGLGIRKGNIEAFGLVLLVSVLITKIFITTLLIGVSPVIINAIISNIAFSLAGIIRLQTILRNNKLLLQHSEAAKLLLL